MSVPATDGCKQPLLRRAATQDLHCPKCVTHSSHVSVSVHGTQVHRRGQMQALEWAGIALASVVCCQECSFEGVAGEFLPDFRWVLSPLEVNVFWQSDEPVGPTRAQITMTAALARKIVRCAHALTREGLVEASVLDDSVVWTAYTPDAETSEECYGKPTLHVTPDTFHWACTYWDGDAFETDKVKIASLFRLD